MVNANFKLAASANKHFQADFNSAKKRNSWASCNRKPGKLSFNLQAYYDKLLLELHTEQVQNVATKFDMAASSFIEKCDGLL